MSVSNSTTAQRHSIERTGSMGLVLFHDWADIAALVATLDRLPESYKVHRLVRVAGVWILEYRAIAVTFDSGDDSNDWTSGLDTGAGDNLDINAEHWTDNGWSPMVVV